MTRDTRSPDFSDDVSHGMKSRIYQIRSEQDREASAVPNAKYPSVRDAAHC